MSTTDDAPTLEQFHAHLRRLATTPEARAFCERLIAAGGDTVNKTVFVFGSNEAGRHGKGAALYARQHHGAIYGQGFGPQGSSFAIPTKDDQLRPLPLSTIAGYVGTFLTYARARPETVFEVTPIGCGLAGFRPEDIAPFFREAPFNVLLPPEFSQLLERPT